MTTIDWIAAGVIAIAALIGLRRGLIGGLLGLAGIVVGAYLGAKLAPEFLSGRESPYTPLVALGGAVVLVILFQSIASMAGSAIRTSLFVLPPLRLARLARRPRARRNRRRRDRLGAGAVALHLPGQRELREEVQRRGSSARSTSASRRRACSTRSSASTRSSRFRGRRQTSRRRTRRCWPSPGVRAARDSVFRVTGSACGLGVSGSGWAAAPNLVVTNAHVVAGMKDPRVDRRDGDYRDAVVVAFDARDDIAVLRVAGLGATPLEAVAPVAGQSVAILGYPESGPFTAAAGRIGQTSDVLTEDAYGRGPVSRRITTLRGDVRHGNSGGPAVDIRGSVQTTIFASRVGVEGQGYGVPTELVRAALAGARDGGGVSTGPCVR